MSNNERIRELEQNIATACVKCPHAKFATGHYQCGQSYRACHSKKVKRWLAEIKRLEAADGNS